jgi:thiamine kinase-like enzyme
MALTLEEAIARVPHWKNAKDLKAVPLVGGITNQNYRIETGGAKYVLRIAGSNTDRLGINRDCELEASLSAANLGIGPEVIYYIQPEGYIITHFIEGRPLPIEELGKPENIAEVARILHKIHSLPPIKGEFSVFLVVKEYTSLGLQYGVPFPDNFNWLIDRLVEIQKVLSVHPSELSVCHNDLLNENFLFDGQIRILDWEYAGMGDRFFDLANFSVNHSFDDEQDQCLLYNYFGQITPATWAKLKIFKVLSDYREAMWGIAQQGISQLDIDFKEYGEKHFRRLTSNIQNPQWGQWLKEITNNA